MNEEERRYRVGRRIAGSTAWFTTDERAPDPNGAIVLHLSRRQLEAGKSYELTVHELPPVKGDA